MRVKLLRDKDGATYPSTLDEYGEDWGAARAGWERAGTAISRSEG